MPHVTDFVQDASKVQNTRMVALFCESHGCVTARGSRKLQICKWCRAPFTKCKMTWESNRLVLQTTSVCIITSEVASKWFYIQQKSHIK